MLTKTVDFSNLLPSTKPIDAKTVCTWYEDAEKLLNELKGCNLKEVSENDVAIIRYLQNYKEQFWIEPLWDWNINYILSH